ncbi:MAG: DUF1294 domain-containing protein [Clostridia bacterium]|nr:DUF1294 domain-containing protein [Clostridia bacterium]
MRFLWFWLALSNLAALVLYGVDKARARRGAWRIPERTLLIVPFFGGALGALLGMLLFRHKIRKLYFWILVLLALLLWVVGTAVFLTRVG